MAWRISLLAFLIAFATFLAFALLGKEPTAPEASPDQVTASPAEENAPANAEPVAREVPPRAGRKNAARTGRPRADPAKVPPAFADAKANKETGLAIGGRVTGPLGRALDEIMVWVRSEADPTLWRKARTGRDGAYRIPGLPAGSYAVEVRNRPRIHWFDDVRWFDPKAPGTRTPFPTPKRTGVRAGTEGVNFQVRLPAAVLGQVVAADTGKPMPHMILRVISPAGGWTSFNASHPEGRFILAFPAAVTFDLTAKAGGCRESNPTHIALAPGEIRQGVVIRVQQGGVLTGRIVHATGKPVRFAQVAVKDAKTGAFLGIKSGLLPADGRYRVTGLPTARARVQVTTVDYLPVIVEDVDLSETGEVVRNITVRDGGEVQVTVRTAEDEPAEGAVITIKNRATGKTIKGRLSYRIRGKRLSIKATGELRTDAKGILVYGPLAAGVHIIDCRYGDVKLDPVTVPIAAGQTTRCRFTLPPNGD
jgi:hypothetical protein